MNGFIVFLEVCIENLLNDLKSRKKSLQKKLLEIKQEIQSLDYDIKNINIEKELTRQGFVRVNSFYKSYMINNKGRIFNIKSGKELKHYKNNVGYVIIGLYKDNKRKNLLLHRLVAQAFIPNPNNLPEINHKDGNKENNDVDNLEWCSRSQNMIHLFKLNAGQNIKSSPKAPKKIIQYDTNYNLVRRWDCIKDASIEYKTCISSIVKCCKGKYKTCKGYIWRYDN